MEKEKPKPGDFMFLQGQTSIDQNIFVKLGQFLKGALLLPVNSVTSLNNLFSQRWNKVAYYEFFPVRQSNALALVN